MKNLFCFLLLSSITLQNQSLSQSFCNTDGNSGNSLAGANSNARVGTDDCTSFRVRLRFHIVRNSNGTGGQPVGVINTVLNNFNNIYNPHRITFNNLGFDFVDDSNYMSDFNDSKFNTLVQINRVENAINVYLLDNNTWNQGSAGTVGSKALVVGGNLFGVNLVTSHVVSHELGHCLNLFHTHHSGCEGQGCLENPDGSNCSSCGDYICDTPADPFINFATNGACNWTGTPDGVCDNSAWTYNPQTNNVMSYARPLCLQMITNGQGERIRISLLTAPLETVVEPFCTCPPDLSTMSYDYYYQANTVNFISPGNHSVQSNIVPNLLVSPIAWSAGSFTAWGNTGPNNVSAWFYLSSGQSVTFSISAATNCGNSSRNITFVTSSGYRVYPNPAKEVAYVEFDNATYGEALPERVELLSEKSTKPIKSVDVQEAFASKSLQGGNKISFDVKGLPRGIYYLHIINSKDKGKELDAVRILLE